MLLVVICEQDGGPLCAWCSDVCRFSLPDPTEDEPVGDYLDIPIFINARDRVTDLRRLVRWLDDAGYRDVTILDNASTYPPLLDYYAGGCPVRVVDLGCNYGKHAIWRAGLVPHGERFVWTDPDLVPVDRCPRDLVERCVQVMDETGYMRVGPGLSLSGVDASMPSYEWERSLMSRRLVLRSGIRAFDSMIDTTFALVEANASEYDVHAARLAWPYAMVHSSWYPPADDVTRDEREYYLAHAIGGDEGSTWKDAVGRI